MKNQEEQETAEISGYSQHVLGREAFAALYPTIEEIQVTVKRNGNSKPTHADTQSYFDRYEKDVVDYVDCTNPLCRNGGFSIANLIEKMVVSNQTYLQKDYIPCPGYEDSSPRVGRTHQCTNFFGIRIDIKYKSQSYSEDTESA